jgi:hypothetical protein
MMKIEQVYLPGFRENHQVFDRMILCLLWIEWYPTLGAKTKARPGWGTQRWYNNKRSEN